MTRSTSAILPARYFSSLMVSHRWIVLASVTLISLVAVGWIADHSTRVVADSVESLDHTRDVLLQIDQFRAALAAVDSSARGYVITGAPSFSSDFQRADRSARHGLARLKALAQTDARERALLTVLDALTVSRLGELSDEVSSGGQTAQAGVHGRIIKGRQNSRQIEEALDNLRAEELDHLREQASRAESARRFAIFGPWALCFFTAISLAAMLLQVAATLRRAKKIRIDLQTAALLEHEARQRAQEADEMKDQFLATVSHELRTPLTSIIGWCGLLSDERFRPTLLDEGLAGIANAAHVQSELVEDLLDVSRIVAGRLEPHVAELNLVRIVEAAIVSVAPSAQAKGITLLEVVEDGEPHAICGDARRLEQVFANLLSNAVKFTPANGVIGVAIRWTDAEVAISVTDNGEGIEPDLLPHIFDRFRQGHATGARIAGLGLGLSIVKSLVELHGGKVRAESAGVGRGATFVVELPLTAAQSEQAELATQLQPAERYLAAS